MKRLFLTKLIDFPKIRHKNVEYFNFVHAHKQKFGLFWTCFFFFFFFFCNCPFQTFFLPFSSRFFYSSYSLHFISFLAVAKKWVLTEDKAWKCNHLRPFTTIYDHFCTKTDNVDFQVATSQCMLCR